MLGDSFGDWVGAGFGEIVYQRSGVIGEGIEFYNGEVSFCERAGLVEEDCCRVLGILNRFDGLGAKSG